MAYISGMLPEIPLFLAIDAWTLPLNMSSGAKREEGESMLYSHLVSSGVKSCMIHNDPISIQNEVEKK